LNSLIELKKITQSMNQDITDDAIHTFQNEISRLEYSCKNDTILIPFFKMMRALGKYIGSKKNNAHSDSIPMLNSLVQKLDDITRNPNPDADETHQILSGEIQNYRSLKTKIASMPLIENQDINDLKEVILAIDWEISETTLQNFENVVTSLLSKSKKHKIYYTFLKIIHSTGRYIATQKANAQTESISFLQSVLDDFCTIVENSGMEINEKKQILESVINRFQQFKLSISKPRKTANQPAEATGQPAETTDQPAKITETEEDIQPALSHIQSTGATEPDSIAPLTTLSDQENFVPTTKLSGSETTNSGPKDKEKTQPAGPKDVMDDLFTAKETPADELLDAIHLMDVNGSNQDQAMNMLDQTSGLSTDGAQNFTPQRKDTTPIPEIENRLDEFFSLDIPGEPSLESNDQADTPIETTTKQKDLQEERIIPFQDQDNFFQDKDQEETQKEYVEENLDETPDKTLDKKDEDVAEKTPDSIILNRLKSTIEDSEWIRYEASMLSISEDISYLQNCWKNDPEKTCLLEIITSITTSLNNKEVKKPNHEDTVKNLNDRPKSGVWGKIKGLFTS